MHSDETTNHAMHAQMYTVEANCNHKLYFTKENLTCKRYIRLAIAFILIYVTSALGLSNTAYAQIRNFDSVSENFTPNRAENFACSTDVGVLANGSIAGNDGYCPRNGQPTYEISFNLNNPNIDDFYESLVFYANAGSIYTDGELDLVNIEIDYLDTTSGLLTTFSQNDVDIGNTINATTPRIITFDSLSGLPADIAGISQVRLSDPRTSVGSLIEAAFREVQVTYSPGNISLVKSASLDLGSDGVISVGDIITYNYVVTNESATVTLFNITLSEPAGNFSGTGTLPTPNLISGGNDYDGGVGTATDIRGGEIITYAATYAITQDDIDANGVSNQAVVSGTSFNGDPVSDLSGTTPTNDTATVLTLIKAITATPETFPVIDGSAGGNTTSILASDTLNGTPVNLANVDITINTSDPQLSLNVGTGLISIAGSTPNGSYTVTYTICETSNPTNCASATETVTVGTPTPNISLPPPSCGAIETNFFGLSFSAVIAEPGSSDTFRLTNAGTVNGIPVELLASFTSPGAPSGGQAPRIDSSDNFIFNSGIPRTVTYQIVILGTTTPINGNLRFRLGDLDSNERLELASSQVSAIIRNTPTNLTISETGGIVTIIGSPSAGSTIPEDTVEFILENTSTFTLTAIPSGGNSGFTLDASISLPFTGEVCTSDIITVKTLDSTNSTPSVGDTVSYALDVTNNGPFPINDLTLTDNLPSGISYLSDTPGSTTTGTTSYDEATGLWTIGTLAQAETVRLILSGTIDSGSENLTLTNTTTAATSPSIIDSDTTTDDLSESITIAPSLPDLSAVKTVAMFNPTELAIPGNDVIYTISVTNAGDGTVDRDTVFLVDRIPAEIDIFIGDIDDAGPETNPVSFVDTSSGLTFNYTDDVGFSNDTTAPADFTECTFSPAAGYNANITYICFNPKGILATGNPDPGFSLSFRARVK